MLLEKQKAAFQQLSTIYVRMKGLPASGGINFSPLHPSGIKKAAYWQL